MSRSTAAANVSWALIVTITAALLAPAAGFPEAQPEKETPIDMQMRFTDVTEAAGIRFVHTWGAPRMRNMLDSAGGGGGFLDYDNDGDMDIYFVQGGDYNKDGSLPPDKKEHNVLYRNNGNGTFTDVTETAGVGDNGVGMACAAADYDNDGDQDLFVTNYQGDVLYRNNGDGTFTDITEAAGLASPKPWSSGTAFADIDNDGDLDLYIVQYLKFRPDEERISAGALSKRQGFMFFAGPRDYEGVTDVLYRNNGDGTFTDITKEAGLREGGKGIGVVFADLDADGDQDIYISNDNESPNFLYENDGEGHFREIGFERAVAVSEDGDETSGMSIAVDDYNGDGRLDFVVTNMIFEVNSFYRNEGGGLYFKEVAEETGVGKDSYRHVGFGAVFVDVDNDGWRDLIFSNGHMVDYIDAFSQSFTSKQTRTFYRNLGNGSFEYVRNGYGDIPGPKKLGRGLAYADFDNDGDMDLLTTNAGDRPILCRNDGGNQNHWLRIRTIGTRSNRDGIGARVKVTAGGRTQIGEVRHQCSYYSTHDPRLLFGLGRASRVDAIEVYWPSGQVDRTGPVDADQSITIREGEG